MRFKITILCFLFISLFFIQKINCFGAVQSFGVEVDYNHAGLATEFVFRVQIFVLDAKKSFTLSNSYFIK